jgi:hypothetical protein
MPLPYPLNWRLPLMSGRIAFAVTGRCNLRPIILRLRAAAS